MTTFTDWINALDSFVWGPAMLVLILGTGLYLQVRLGGMPVRKIGAGLRLRNSRAAGPGLDRACARVWGWGGGSAGARGQTTMRLSHTHSRTTDSP